MISGVFKFFINTLYMSTVFSVGVLRLFYEIGKDCANTLYEKKYGKQPVMSAVKGELGKLAFWGLEKYVMFKESYECYRTEVYKMAFRDGDVLKAVSYSSCGTISYMNKDSMSMALHTIMLRFMGFDLKHFETMRLSGLENNGLLELTTFNGTEKSTVLLGSGKPETFKPTSSVMEVMLVEMNGSEITDTVRPIMGSFTKENAITCEALVAYLLETKKIKSEIVKTEGNVVSYVEEDTFEEFEIEDKEVIVFEV